GAAASCDCSATCAGSTARSIAARKVDIPAAGNVILPTGGPVVRGIGKKLRSQGRKSGGRRPFGRRRARGGRRSVRRKARTYSKRGRTMGWGKRTEVESTSTPEEVEPVVAKPVAPAAPRREPAAEGSQHRVGKSVRVKGELNGGEDVRVDGGFEG